MAHSFQDGMAEQLHSHQADRKRQREGIASVSQTEREPQLHAVILSSLRSSLHLLDILVYTNPGFVALMQKSLLGLAEMKQSRDFFYFR